MRITTGNKQALWRIAAIVLTALEILIGLGWISRLVPVVYKDPATGQVMPLPPGLEPEREMLLYGMFCAMVFLAGFFVFVRRMRLPVLFSRVLPVYVRVQAVLVCAHLALAFKFLTYQYPFYAVLIFENGSWVLPCVCVLFVISILIKVFWPECQRWAARCIPQLGLIKIGHRLSMTGEGVFLGMICLILWVPDTRIPLAVGFWMDHLNGIDQKFGWLASLGWEYAAIIKLVMIIGIGSVLGFYLCLRWWGRPVLLSMAGTLWFIKWRFFGYDANPVHWITEQSVSLPLAWAGFHNGPMFAPLQVRQFWAFDMQFAIPIIYMISLLLLSTRRWAMISFKDHAVLWGLSCVGLVLFADAVLRPSISRYAYTAWPLIAMTVWGAHRLIEQWPRTLGSIGALGLAALISLAVMTNRVFVVYPNAFNPGKERFANAIDGWSKAWDFKPQAELIRKWVPEGQPTAVLSSFECRLLQQSGRRSLWPFVPALRSEFPGENALPMLAVTRKGDLSRLKDALERRLPAHIFVEAKIWKYGQMSKASDTGLADLIAFVAGQYVPVAQEDFLVALRRKDLK